MWWVVLEAFLIYKRSIYIYVGGHHAGPHRINESLVVVLVAVPLLLRTWTRREEFCERGTPASSTLPECCWYFWSALPLVIHAPVIFHEKIFPWLSSFKPNIICVKDFMCLLQMLTSLTGSWPVPQHFLSSLKLILKRTGFLVGQLLHQTDEPLDWTNFLNYFKIWSKRVFFFYT